MSINELMETLFEAIKKPQSKAELADTIGLSIDELLLLLDAHCPEGFTIHERDGFVQLVSFNPDLCNYLNPEGVQCTTKPGDRSDFCYAHREYCTISPELRLFAQFIGRYGFPGENPNIWKRGDARRVRRLVLDSPLNAPRDRSFLALVADLQEKSLNGGLTDRDEEKLRTLIRRSCLVETKPGNSHGEAV